MRFLSLDFITYLDTIALYYIVQAWPVDWRFRHLLHFADLNSRSGSLRIRLALKCAALLDLGLFSNHTESLVLALEQFRRVTLYGEPRDTLGDIRAAYWFDTVVRLYFPSLFRCTSFLNAYHLPVELFLFIPLRHA